MTATSASSELVDSPLAWRMAAIAFTVGFVVYGVLYSFGIFLQPLMADFGASRSATSALYGISSSMFYLVGPVSGSLGVRYGPRFTVIVGALIMVGGLFATASLSSVWIAYLTYGLCVGVGAGCAYIPTFAILGGWFERQRTRALSIGAAGTGCGMLIIPPTAASLVQSIGWRGAMIGLALLSGALLTACAMFVRAPPRRQTERPAPLGEALTSRSFILMYASWVFGTMALIVAIVFLPAFAISEGIDPVAASWLISILGGASIFGRLGIGSVTNPGGTVFLYKVSILAMAASYIVWLLHPSYAWLVVFSAALGLAYGIRIALVAPVLIVLFGAARLGVLLGSFFTASAISGFSGPMVASLVMDASGDQASAIIAALAMGAIGFLFILPLKAPVRR
ncbi:MAG: MFS transporter [Hyphomicrobiaceae bacterium]